MSGITAFRPGFLLLLLLGPALVVAWRRWPPPLSPRRSRLALALHLAMLMLLVVALADTRISRRPHGRAVIAVVDLSDSAQAGREEAASAVRRMIEGKGSDDLFGVVTFGRDTQVELPPTQNPSFVRFQTRPDGAYSDLGSALQLAGNLLPEGYGRQIVLLSDGRQNLGDASRIVSQLRNRSVRVDVMALGSAFGPEALMLDLESPHELRSGQRLPITARMRATAAAAGQIVLQVDGVVQELAIVDLPPGDSARSFEIGPLPDGFHQIKVLLEATPDGSAQNNAAGATVRVLGRPSVLLLERTREPATNVQRVLEAAGFDVESRRAEGTPTEPAGLAQFDGMVIADVPVESFPEGALASISTAVRDFGRGLVALGGNQSYGPGGWKGTPLEEALPVLMDPRQPRKRPAVAVVIMIETMESTRLNGAALGAVKAVMDQLTPDDEVGIIRMAETRGEDTSGFVVPLGPPEEAMEEGVRQINLNDPPGYSRSLGLAFDALRSSSASVKHAVLIGDGDALGDVGEPHANLRGGPLPDYGELLSGALRAGITTSAIGVDIHDTPRFMDHMQRIGDLGGGGFFLSRSPEQVPEVILSQARSSLRPAYEQTPFLPIVTSAGDVLAGVDLGAFPKLQGYVVTTPKPTADVVLASPKGDPVLAAGQHGLGRAVAWTSDTEGRWTRDFLASPVSSALLGRMVAWSLPTGGPEPIRLEAALRGDGLDVTVGGPEPGGDLRLDVFSPTGETMAELPRPIAPGRWQATVPAAAVGTYMLHAVLTRDGVVVGQGEQRVSVPYSPEYLEQGRDEALLRQLASQGGALVSQPASVWSLRTPPVTVTSPIFWMLLLVAILLWPVDVALRRLTLSVPKIVGLVRAERSKRLRTVRASPEPASRLRTTMESARRQATERPAGQPSGSSSRRTGPTTGDSHEEELAARLRDRRKERRDESAVEGA